MCVFFLGRKGEGGSGESGGLVGMKHKRTAWRNRRQIPDDEVFIRESKKPDVFSMIARYTFKLKLHRKVNSAQFQRDGGWGEGD